MFAKHHATLALGLAGNATFTPGQCKEKCMYAARSRTPYVTKTVTWGGQAKKDCTWQCTCEQSERGCDSEDRCARYEWTEATKRCQLYSASTEEECTGFE